MIGLFPGNICKNWHAEKSKYQHCCADSVKTESKMRLRSWTFHMFRSCLLPVSVVVCCGWLVLCLVCRVP